MKQTFSTKSKIIEFSKVMFPIVVSQIAIISTSFFSTVMAGHLSEADLAGVALGTNLYLPFFTALIGVVSALTPIIAGYYGAEKFQSIGFATGQGIYWSVLLSLIFIVLGYLSVPTVLEHLALTPQVEQVTSDFLFYLSFGMPIFFVFVVLKNLIDAHGLTRITMGITIFTVPINISLNYVFMYGAFGMPSFGGAGAGLGMAVSFCVSFLIAALIVMFMKPFSDYKIFQTYVRPSFATWIRHLKIGVPIGGAIFCENSIFGVVGLWMSVYGTTIIAAHQVTINFTTLMYMIPLSASFALAILVGYEIGAGRERDARNYITIGRVWAFSFIGILTLIAFQYRVEIAEIYTTSPEVLRILPTFLIYGALMQVADSINAPIQGALRGYKDVNITFLLSLVSYWAIGLPLGIFLAYNTSFSYYGFWLGLTAGVVFGAIFLFLRMKTVQKKLLKNG